MLIIVSILIITSSFTKLFPVNLCIEVKKVIVVVVVPVVVVISFRNGLT